MEQVFDGNDVRMHQRWPQNIRLMPTRSPSNEVKSEEGCAMNIYIYIYTLEAFFYSCKCLQNLKLLVPLRNENAYFRCIKERAGISYWMLLHV